MTGAAASATGPDRADQPDRLLAILLASGAAASLLFVGADIIAALIYAGYSYADQQVSELSAIGAPTRPLWIAMSIISTPMVVAFGIGILRVARGKRSLAATGALTVAYAIIGLAWVLFAPMNLRGATGSLTDTMHLVFTAVQVGVMVTFIACGAVALGGTFRAYSIVTIAAMLLAGLVVGIFAAPAIAAGLPTPWMGAVERVSVYAPMFWTAVLSLILLRDQADAARYGGGSPAILGGPMPAE